MKKKTKSRLNKRILPIITLLFTFSVLAGGKDNQEDVHQPNILWITCEDISPHLGCYGDPYAYTPTLDELGRRGIIFSHAFSAASVCTPARSTIITGVYASSMGTQHLRAEMNLSKNIRCFTEYLRDAGYYCSNNVKEDYNFETPPGAWDESSKEAHWRNREPGQPFFSIFNFTLTHQSQTRYDEETLIARNAELLPEARHHWKDAPVPPYYPDTREVRSNIAALHTQITLLDYKVKELLSQLKEDRLDEETVIFFYSDHGDGLPRHKRWIHDTGTRVPFIVYVPEKFRHLSFFANGTIVPDLISFEDLAPTMLSIAGIPRPDYMKGRALFPGRDEKRDFIITIRDRVDENYLFSRGVRGERFHYIRNFFPLLPRMPYSDYSEVTPIRKEIRRLNREGKLHGHAAWLVQETTPAEELYDTENDPLELNNLAGDPEYSKELKRMQTILKEWMIMSKDLSLIPEPEMMALSGGSSAYDVFSRKSKKYFTEAFDAADKVGKENSPAEFIKGMNSGSDIVQFWSLSGLQVLQSNGYTVPVRDLEKLLNDDSEIVRIKAAELILWQENNARANQAFMNILDQDDTAGKMHAVIAIFGLYRNNRIDATGFKDLLTDSQHESRKFFSWYIKSMTDKMYSE